MKYIIDQTDDRGPTWERAFTDARLVHMMQKLPAAIGSGDFVFAHTDTDFDLEATGDLQDITSQFRRLLCADFANAPLFVMYSGGPLNLTERERWKKRCIEKALPGFPPDRVKVLVEPILRQVTVVDLRKMIGEFIASGDSQKDSVEREIHREALHLLCEAWRTVNVAGQSKLNGFPIYAPAEIGEWLGVFEAGANRDSIASKMGHFSEPAKSLFEKVERSGRKDDVQAAVEAFLRAGALRI